MAAKSEIEKAGSEQTVGSDQAAKQEVVPRGLSSGIEESSKPVTVNQPAKDAEPGQKKDAQPAQSSQPSKKDNGMMLVAGLIILGLAIAATVYFYKENKKRERPNDGR